MSQRVNVIIHAPHLAPAEAPQVSAPQAIPIVSGNFITKTGRLLRALREWQKAGRPLTPKPERNLRLAICANCTFWNPSGNFGLGACNAPGCGCTQFKAWLATEKCPHPDGSKWPQTQPGGAAPTG